MATEGQVTTELKKPKFYLTLNSGGASSPVYNQGSMDSFLSACADQLEQVKKLREEAENRFNDAHDAPNPMSDSLMRRYRFLKRKASNLENIVIATLKGE